MRLTTSSIILSLLVLFVTGSIVNGVVKVYCSSFISKTGLNLVFIIVAASTAQEAEQIMPSQVLQNQTKPNQIGSRIGFGLVFEGLVLGLVLSISNLGSEH